MKKEIKEYKFVEGVTDGIPTKDGTDSDFKKYRKDTKSTTWVVIFDNVMRFLTQINSRKEFYAGYMSEPYILFLNNSKYLMNILNEIEKEFSLNVLSTIPLSENFQLKVLNQEIYNRFVNTKISSLVSLIMSVESFINNFIPDDFILEDKKGRRTKKDIEKNFSLKDKFKDVIPKIKKIDNYRDYQTEYSRIIQLSEIRNSFVHLKTVDVDGKPDAYFTDFEKLISLKLEKEIITVEKLFENLLK